MDESVECECLRVSVCMYVAVNLLSQKLKMSVDISIME